jgi:hypothetical protein
MKYVVGEFSGNVSSAWLYGSHESHGSDDVRTLDDGCPTCARELAASPTRYVQVEQPGLHVVA